MEPRRCPLNHLNGFTEVFQFHDRQQSFSLVRCQDCGLVMLDPIPSPEVLQTYYADDYYGEKNTKFIPLIQWFRLRSAGQRIASLKPLAHQPRTILDVGCAGGFFLYAMHQRGWETVGIESSDAFQSSPYLIGTRFLVGDLLEQRLPPKSFSVITLWHVFEHITTPTKTLDELARVLRDDGTVVMSMPNIASWQAKIFGRRWFHLDLPRHVFHYSPSTITTLLEQHQFTVVSIKHFSFEYNPYGYIQSILNVLFSQQNALYEALKNTRSSWLRFFTPTVIGSLLLIPFVLPLGVIASIIESIARRGGTMTVYAKKHGAKKT